jgi:hypothetical protein
VELFEINDLPDAVTALQDRARGITAKCALPGSEQQISDED